MSTKKVGGIIVLSIIIFIIYGQLKSYRYEKELERNGILRLGKLTVSKKLPKEIIYIYHIILEAKNTYLLRADCIKMYCQKTLVNFIK